MVNRAAMVHTDLGRRKEQTNGFLEWTKNVAKTFQCRMMAVVFGENAGPARCPISLGTAMRKANCLCCPTKLPGRRCLFRCLPSTTICHHELASKASISHSIGLDPANVCELSLGNRQHRLAAVFDGGGNIRLCHLFRPGLYK